MENIANKVGDEVRAFWFATENLVLNNFSLEVFENDCWRVIFDNVSLTNLSKEQICLINEHKKISRDFCEQFGLPGAYNLVESSV